MSLKQQDFDLTSTDKIQVFEEWVGMPEFVQEKQRPYSSIIVRFATKKDLDEFSILISQKLTDKTKSIWHPQLVRGINSAKRYVDES